MAGRNEGCASIGCLGLVLLFLIAMCTGGGSDGDTGGGYDPTDLHPSSAPAPVAPPAVVEDAPPPQPRELHVGPRGGCYYVSDSGNKTYVDRSECADITPPAAAAPLLSSPSRSSSEDPRRSDGTQLHVGSRGGCYYINGSGRKMYVDRSACAGITPPAAAAPQLSSPSGSSSQGPRRSGGRQLHVGPRGGCYYYNSNGNKTYVDRSECY